MRLRGGLLVALIVTWGSSASAQSLLDAPVPPDVLDPETTFEFGPCFDAVEALSMHHRAEMALDCAIVPVHACFTFVRESDGCLAQIEASMSALRSSMEKELRSLEEIEAKGIALDGELFSANVRDAHQDYLTGLQSQFEPDISNCPWPQDLPENKDRDLACRPLGEAVVLHALYHQRWEFMLAVSRNLPYD